MLDAREARRLTDEALEPEAEAIKPFLERVEARVRKAAKEGQRTIAHPFMHFEGMPRLDSPSGAVQTAVRKAVEAMGYTWTSHPDPDPGSPTSGPYTTISW